MIKVITYDKHPITLIGECVGNCYGSDTSDPVKNFKRGKQCIDDGHGRVLEYPDVIMEFDEYSIKVVREFYTHIGGSPTRTQESTRYVNMKEREYFTPPKINFDGKAYTAYSNAIDVIWDTYEQLVEMDIPKEDASMILPLGMHTKFVVKMNARQILQMANVRMCTRAYHEYRKLMNEFKDELSKLDTEWKMIADMMKPKCEVVGYCEEHHSCGRKPKKNDSYDELSVKYNDALQENISLKDLYNNLNEEHDALLKDYGALKEQYLEATEIDFKGAEKEFGYEI